MLSTNKHYWDMPQHFYGEVGSFDIQTNPEWLKVRRGKFTASQAAEILSSERGGDGLGKTALKAIDRVFAEKYTNWSEPDDSQSWAEKPQVARGLELEPEARRLYEKQTGFKVRQCGFVEHGSGFFGFSPDGMIEGENGAVEIKSPEAPGAQRLIREVGDTDHLKQIAFAMWLDDLDFYDYVVYCPELCDGLVEMGAIKEHQVFIWSFDREELAEYIDALDKRAPMLIECITGKIKEYKSIGTKRIMYHKRSK